MCDPLVEICPEQYGEAIVSMETKETGFKFSYDVEPYSILWGASATAMVYYCMWAKDMYVSHFMDDNLQWVDRIAAVGTQYDEDWVLATPESRAWA